MNSIFSKLSQVIASASLISSIGFGGSVSGGGGNTKPADPIGSARIAAMLPGFRGPIVSYFWAVEDLDRQLPERKYSVFFDGPITVYDVIDSLNIQAITDGPCFDSSGKEVDGSSYTDPATGICISTYRLGYKLDNGNAFSQTMGLVIHEISHKFGFDEEAATNLQADVIRNTSWENPWDFGNRLQDGIGRLYKIFDALNSIKASSDWNLICSNAQALKRQHDEIRLLMYRSSSTSVIRWSRRNQIFDDSWNILGLGIAGCGLADSPLKTEEDEWNFMRYLKAFGDSKRLTIKEFSKNYSDGKTTVNSDQEIIKIDTISSAAKESGNLLERQAGLLDDFFKLQNSFLVTRIEKIKTLPK